MISHCSSPALANRVSSLYLDYGADAQECGRDDVQISSLGMSLHVRWSFEIGTQLQLSFVCGRGVRAGERFLVEVLVVSCAPMVNRPGMFELTLLFTNLPEPLRELLDAA